MATEHLNVQYLSNKPITIKVSANDRLTDVVTAIANFYKDSISSPERIQLFDNENTLISTWRQFKALRAEYFAEESGVSLTVVLLPLPASSANLATLIGRVMKVCVNQNKLIKKYLTPVGSSPSTPSQNAPTTADLSQLTLKLDYPLFYTNSSYRYCIVIDYRPSVLPLLAPSITIVLITAFNDKPLEEMLVQEDLSRVMPISPTPVRPGTGSQLITTPEWMPHPKHKSPCYVLCIPIKVNLVQIEACDEDDTTFLDAANLQTLKLHLLSLGGLTANAEFVDSDEEESDNDSVEVRWYKTQRHIVV